MIAINSTGYPCLAVIQHFNIPEEHHARVYALGRRFLDHWLHGMPYRAVREADRVCLSPAALEQLMTNYFAAAKIHKWGPFNVH